MCVERMLHGIGLFDCMHGKKMKVGIRQRVRYQRRGKITSRL